MRLCYGCMRFCQDSCDICPDCGYVFGTESVIKNHLSYGTCLKDRYIVGRSLAHGEFAITYIAWDNIEQKTVVVKEFFAKALSNRTKGSTHIFCYNEKVEAFFRSGVKKAVAECEKIRAFSQHENLVRIEDCFEENNTAYIVFEYLEGKDLKRTLEENSGRLSVETVINIFSQVFSALSCMHEKGVIHAGVSPDKIFICADGRVKLLDFGSERLNIENEDNSLSVMPERGYSAPEKYNTGVPLTAQTDIYSACAVMYAAVTGTAPIEAVKRNVVDLKSFAACSITDYNCLEKALLKGLELQMSDRYVSIVQAQQAIEEAFESDDALRRAVKEQDSKETRKRKLPLIAVGVVAAVAAAALIIALVVGALS